MTYVSVEDYAVAYVLQLALGGTARGQAIPIA